MLLRLKQRVDGEGPRSLEELGFMLVIDKELFCLEGFTQGECNKENNDISYLKLGTSLKPTRMTRHTNDRYVKFWPI